MMILIVIGVLVLAELLALAWMATTVSSYKKFWTQKAQESGEITYLALGDSAAQGIGYWIAESQADTPPPR